MNHQFIGIGTFGLVKPVHECELNFAEWLWQNHIMLKSSGSTEILELSKIKQCSRQIQAELF